MSPVSRRQKPKNGPIDRTCDEAGSSLFDPKTFLGFNINYSESPQLSRSNRSQKTSSSIAVTLDRSRFPGLDNESNVFRSQIILLHKHTNSRTRPDPFEYFGYSGYEHIGRLRSPEVTRTDFPGALPFSTQSKVRSRRL